LALNLICSNDDEELNNELKCRSLIAAFPDLISNRRRFLDSKELIQPAVIEQMRDRPEINKTSIKMVQKRKFMHSR
jgi:hypothetical protein